MQDHKGVESNPAATEQEAGCALDRLPVHHMADI